jgi:electron transport complex protein RnfG
MREPVKIIASLTALLIVAGLLVAFVFAKTIPIRIEAEQREKEMAIRAMAPEADVITLLGTWTPYPKKPRKVEEYYKVVTNDKIVGYIISTQGRGYQSYIRILVAIDVDHTIKEINVVWQGETPGFGEEIQKPRFIERFTGKRLENMEITMIEEPGKIQAVTGATVSSRAVVEGVRLALELAKDRLIKDLPKGVNKKGLEK